MALEFTNIEKQRGTVIYFIHDGTEKSRHNFERLYQTVIKRTRKHAVLLSIKDEDAVKIKDFFHLNGSHFILIVRENDQLHHMWTAGDNMDESHIVHIVEQTG